MATERYFLNWLRVFLLDHAGIEAFQFAVNLVVLGGQVVNLRLHLNDLLL